MEKAKGKNNFATISKPGSEQVRQFLKTSARYLGLALDGEAGYQAETRKSQQYGTRINTTGRELFESRL